MKDFVQQFSLHQNSCLPLLLFFCLLIGESFIQNHNFLIGRFATVSALVSILDVNLYRIKDTKENDFCFFSFLWQIEILAWTLGV